MRILKASLALSALLGASCLLAAPAGAPGAGYHVVKKIPLGGEGFWDYLTLDSASRRLFVSHGTHVIVLNPDTGEKVGDIPDTPGVHGVAVAEDLGKGFTSNGRSSTVSVFDLKTLKVEQEIKTTGNNPDAILYDPYTHRIFTFNGRSDNATAIDAKTGKVAGTIALSGKPEFATSDAAGHVYVNLEDKSEVAVIDPEKLTVEKVWPLAPGEEPSGMAIDRAHHRLFVGCHNQMMAVVDAASGKVIATPPIGEGVDANRFDPETGLAFSSNGEGTLTVIREETPEKFVVVANVPTQRGARTMALDEKTHHVFVATAEFGPPPAPTAERPHPRPSIVPGSFLVLELAP
jgi:DNA-binding beta-propeller fold protein YncE